MSRKAQRILNVAITALGLFLAIGVKTFLSPCVHADGSEAICTGAGQLLFWLGIALALAGCAGVWFPTEYRWIPATALLALSVLVILVPGTLKPLCVMTEMRCNLVTRPAALVTGVFSAVLSLALLTGSIRKR